MFRAYFDCRGNLYPPRSVVTVDAGALRANPSGALPTYFKTDAVRRDSLLRGTLGSSAPRALNETAWRAVQDSLHARLARDIRKAVLEGPEPALLVVLIHGFNVPAGEAGFEAVQRRIRDLSLTRRRLVFLEVHWDGLTQPLVPLGAWAGAREQVDSVASGVGDLLARLDFLPVRVLTHSLGGSLATRALWGPGRGSRSWSDLRAAMIVPAMGGSDFRTIAEASVARSTRDRLALGQNPEDVAVSKGGFGAKLMGSTTLATSAPDYGSHVAPLFRGEGREVLRRIYNGRLPLTEARVFGVFPNPLRPLESHDFPGYLRHCSVRPLLHLLLSDKFEPGPQPSCPGN